MTPEQLDQLALEIANETIFRIETGNPTNAHQITEFARRYRAALLERMGPVAWEYRSKITGTETVTRQPPDRVIEPDQFYITAFYSLEDWK